MLERGELASMASGWTLAGVRQLGRHPAELPLATAAVQRWETLSEELDADIEYQLSPAAGGRAATVYRWRYGLAVYHGRFEERV